MAASDHTLTLHGCPVVVDRLLPPGGWELREGGRSAAASPEFAAELERCYTLGHVERPAITQPGATICSRCGQWVKLPRPSR